MTASRLTVPLDWPFSEDFTAELNAWLTLRGLEIQVLRDREHRYAPTVIRFVAVESSGRVVIVKRLAYNPRANIERELRRVLVEWST